MTAPPSALALVHRSAGGRLRFRVAAVRRAPDLARRVETALVAQTEIETVTARPATGSVIVQLAAPLADDAAAELLRAALGRATDAHRSNDTPPTRDGAPAEDGPAWHGMAVETVLERLDSDPSAGLTSDEAEVRRARWGANVLPSAAPRSQLSLLAEQFDSLPVLLLMGSATVSLGTGGFADAAATLAVVGVNAVIGYVTEAQAERTIHALMDTSTQTATVIRGGETISVAAREIVAGDLLWLEPGAVVGADARVIADDGLRVDESALTGETRPVAKLASAGVAPDAPIGERATLLHAGTLVAEGGGRAVVVATAGRTAAARIAALSQSAARPQAPVEAELDRLGGALARVSLGACAVFFGVGWLRGVGLAAILNDALALAVAAVPEGLPVVATTTMSRGLRRMERRGILVRRIDTVESLGALQVLCLDKTGTLTRNRLDVVEAVFGDTPDGETPTTAALREAALAVAALNTDARWPRRGRARVLGYGTRGAGLRA